MGRTAKALMDWRTCLAHCLSSCRPRVESIWNIPSWVIMSATSSLLTDPSLSLSSIWKPSLRTRSCWGCSCDSALPPAAGAGACDRNDTGEPRRGEAMVSGCGNGLERLKSGEAGAATGVDSTPNRDGVRAWPSLEGVPGGVDCLNGDDAAGDSGLRKGELRGDP